MRSNVWSALWRSNFNPSEFIYHYTTFETALKILYSNNFKLSPLSKTNDTTEQKLRIKYAFCPSEEQKNDIPDFEKYWLRWTTNSKLLCFSRDRLKSSNPRVDSLFDMSGRGFALPRMWAQYASNNCGVCLIIRKKSFIENIKEMYPEAICKEVSYYNWSKNYEISEDLFLRTCKIIKHNPATGYAITILKDIPEFAEYTFFCKMNDWEGENEYRILVPNHGDAKENLYIEGVKSYLAGVVVGEHMDNSQVHVIKNVLSGTTPIRKIVFELSRCSVQNIREI